MYYMSAPLIFGLIALLSVEQVGTLPANIRMETLSILFSLWAPAAAPLAARAFASQYMRETAAGAKLLAYIFFLIHTLLGELPALTDAAMAWLPLPTVRLTAAFIPLAVGMLLIDAAAGQFRFQEWTRRLKFQLFPVVPIMGFIVLGDLFEYAPFQIKAAVFERPWLYGAVVLAFLGCSYAFAPSLLRRMWRSSPLEAGELTQRIRAIGDRHNLSFRGVSVWHAGPRFCNAAAAGLLPRRQEIFISEGLINMLDADELEAVAAHEIGHIKRGHLWMYLLFSLSYVAVSILLFAGLSPYLPEFLKETRLGLTMLGAGFFFAYFALLLGFVSRQFERQADQFAAVNASDPTAYPRALSKLHNASLASGGRFLRLPRFLRTHPPIMERIEFAVRAAENDPSAASYAKPLWVSKAVAAATPLLFLGLILFRGAYLPTKAEAAEAVSRIYLREAEIAQTEIEQLPEAESTKREKLSQRRSRLIDHAQDRVLKGLKADPENKNLVYLQGTASLYLNKIEEAEAAFQRALSTDPRHPETLLALASVRLKQGRLGEAADLMERVAAVLPDNREALEIVEDIRKAERELGAAP